MSEKKSSSTLHVSSCPTATVADFVVQCLIDCGVHHVFGGHGGSVVPLINAIMRSNEGDAYGVKWVYCRTEVNAAMAAAAYGKLHRLGVCVGTSGPGASHLVSGAIDAQLDRVPMLVLTGMKDLGKIGHSDFQDIDQTSLFRAAGLPYSVTIASSHQVLPLLRDAISMALSQSCCVHVALPFDLQYEIIKVPEVLCARRADTRYTAHPSKEDLEMTAKLLCNEIASGNRITICVGYRGVKYSGALLELAEALGAPILTSLDAKGTVPEDHHLAHGVLGVFGNAGTESGAQLMAQTDCVLSFCVVDHHQMLTNKEGLQARRLIVFHENTLLADWRFTPTASVIGHLEVSTRAVAAIVRDLRAASAVPPRPPHVHNNSPSRYAADPADLGKAGFCHPGAFLSAVSASLPANSIVSVDVGDITLWTAMSMCLDKPGQRVLSSEHMGIMGYALCGAIAAAHMYPDAQKVAIAGDGGFQMSLQELATLMDHGVNKLLVVVMLNGRLGRVQNESWGAEDALGCSIGCPDIVKLASAYGANAQLLNDDSPEAIAKAVKENLGQPGMRLVAIQQHPDLKPVMHRKQDLKAREGISLFDRGLLSADALCPELSNVVSIERLTPPADVQITCHGSVNYIIDGIIPPEVLATPCDCRNTRHGVGEGSPLTGQEGLNSLGEALVVNGVAYCKSVDFSSPLYLKTLSGPSLTSGYLVGVGPIAATPSFRFTNKFTTSVAIQTLGSHIFDLTQLDAFYIAGIVTCRRGDLAGSALCRPPIYGENILKPENVGRYFCSPGQLGLDNAERCYISGVVARNVDTITSDSVKEVSGKMLGASLAEDLRRILYSGASGSLDKPSTTTKTIPVPCVNSNVPEMHLHGLVLKAGVTDVASITPDHAAPEGVLHLDCRASKITTFDLEVFVIKHMQPHNA